MNSSLINVALIKSNFKRFWPLWLAFAAAWLVFLVLPMALLGPQLATQVSDEFSSMDPLGEIWLAEAVGSVLGIALAALLSASLVFEYLFSKDSAMFHGSLPIKRATLFGSIYLAGLIPLLLVELVVGLLLFALSLSYPCIGVQNVAFWLMLCIGTTFVLYSMAVLCAQFAGSRSMTAVLFVLGNGLIVALEAIVRVLVWSMLWGLEMNFDILTVWTSPVAGIAKYVLDIESAASLADAFSWAALGAYCLAGLAFVAMAAVLNSRRHLEAAGNTVAYNGIRVVITYVIGVTFALVFGFIALFCVAISNNEQGLNFGQQSIVVLLMMIGGFLGIYFGEAYTQKSARVLNKVWAPGLVLAVLSVAFVAGCALDSLGIQNYVPEASKVKAVEVRCQGSESSLDSEKGIQEAIQLHQAILSEGKPTRNADEGDMVEIRFVYKLTDGSEILRGYDIAVNTAGQPSSLEVQTLALLNSDEAILSRYADYLGEDLTGVEVNIELAADSMDSDVDFDGDESVQPADASSESALEQDTMRFEAVGALSADQLSDFLNGPFKKDLLENGAGDIYLRGTGYDYRGTISLCSMSKDAAGFENVRDATNVPLTKENTPNCLKWIKKNLMLKKEKIEAAE